MTRRRIRTGPCLGVRCLGVLLGGLGLTAHPAAQTPSTPQPAVPEGPPTSARKVTLREGPYDEVIGIIGETVILKSAIDRQLEGRQLNSSAEREVERRKILTAIGRDEIWGAYGKVLGIQAPEEFEDALDRELDAWERQEIRRYGSHTAMNEELGLIGTTWQAHRETKRSELLRQFARQEAFRGKVRYRGSLLVTPRRMKAYFDSRPELFRDETSADVEWVSVPRSGDADAASVATTWRETDCSAAELATRIEGIVPHRPQQAIRASDDDQRARFLKDFALGQPVGSVHTETRSGVTLLFKLVARVDARDDQFEDPTVQQRILNLMANEELLDRENRVLVENQPKLFVWPPWLLQRK